LSIKESKSEKDDAGKEQSLVAKPIPKSSTTEKELSQSVPLSPSHPSKKMKKEKIKSDSIITTTITTIKNCGFDEAIAEICEMYVNILKQANKWETIIKDKVNQLDFNSQSFIKQIKEIGRFVSFYSSDNPISTIFRLTTISYPAVASRLVIKWIIYCKNKFGDHFGVLLDKIKSDYNELLTKMPIQLSIPKFDNLNRVSFLVPESESGSPLSKKYLISEILDKSHYIFDYYDGIMKKSSMMDLVAVKRF